MQLLIFGLGYAGAAVARAALADGFTVTAALRGVSRSWSPAHNYLHLPVAEAGLALAHATHLLVTAPPAPEGDPMLAMHAMDVAAAPTLRWIGYFSSTGVYGDRGGNWVSEATPPAPGSERAERRLTAEAAWADYANRCAVDIFRLAGIYGPGRSPFDDLLAGRARRIIKPGHAFGRIHRDDIARAVLAAMRQDLPAAPRILNLNDDEPAESAAVIAEAARLLGVTPPPAIPFAKAWETMSPMARSFWSENRKVSSRATQAALNLGWEYPSYREGLAAILREQNLNQPL